MPVLAIGGLFFRARDPDALAAWYREHLGIGPGRVSVEGAEARITGKGVTGGTRLAAAGIHH